MVLAEDGRIGSHRAVHLCSSTCLVVYNGMEEREDCGGQKNGQKDGKKNENDG
ncbi:MAG: hypothetical protein WC242_00725 [Candidatus Paceibacterota bacterium]